MCVICMASLYVVAYVVQQVIASARAMGPVSGIVLAGVE